MRKLLGVVLLLSIGTVWADCPFSITCPYDGESMQNTYNCKGVGQTRACEFSHQHLVIDAHGSHFVTHRAWASCAD
jgi:hypothetical protein